ncbi:MAG: SDR family NAD(P)-dependent oxidoreductase [Coleofasciculus sp. G3-WIS-01]|uniref:SDR family NAD(P)-dependent oxidoreductase n=1 Tax=Coleofasciculus sp. G3-WIS-01 TaxID=3069528 RepID=UPI0033021306
MVKNILITGGAGFIGSHLAESLFQKGYNITILDNLSNQVHENYFTKNNLKKLQRFSIFFQGDIRNQKDNLKVLENQDVLIHLAAETGTGQSMYQIEQYIDVNLRGLGILLEQITNGSSSIQKIILSSSRAVYGEGKYFCQEHGNIYPSSRKIPELIKGNFDIQCPFCNHSLKCVPTDEESPIKPLSIYGITKASQEQLVKNVCEHLGIDYVIFRYQNVYGPGQSLSNPYTGILSIFSTRLLNGHPINIWEDGLESRDFIYIDDVIEATILGLEHNQANNQIFNVGSGRMISVLQVAEILRHQYGLDSEIDLTISGNFRVGDIRHNCADLSKIKNQLGFQPKYTFEQGISKFVKWVKQQSVSKDYYESSIDELKRIKGLFYG